MVRSAIALSTLAGIARPSQAQSLATGMMPKVEITHATGSNLMQFPVAVSMDFKMADNTIVKKIILGWGNTMDTPTAPVNNEWKSSWDGGLTWSANITNAPLVNLGTAIRLLNGNMVSIPFAANRSVNPSSTLFTFDYQTSTNNGGNWSAATGGTITFPTYAYWMRFHRGMFQENDGTLYAPAYVAYANNGAQTRSVLLKSTDNGHSWTQHAEITNPATHGQFDELAVTRCANGDWLAVIRQAFPSASEYMPLKYARSTDKGVTWSAPAYLPGLGSAHTSGDDLNESVDPDLLLLPNGVLVLSYGRPNVHVAFSADGNGTNWTNVQTNFTEVPGTLGQETTGYTAVVPISAHRFMLFGDTGANWSYPANPSPNPFSMWSRYIDVARPQQNRIDLKKRLAYGVLTVMPATTLTYTDAAHPEARTSAPFDGSVDYWSGALGTNSGVYQVDLQKTFEINAIGVALLRGVQQSATVQYSTDGVNWSLPVVSYTNATHYAINYTNVTQFKARYVKVNVSGTGQIGLAELELYEASSTFENSCASGSTAINGLMPLGYSWAGTSSTQYGCSVQDGQGCASNRALKLMDNSPDWYGGIKRIEGGSNTKTLEFLARATSIPAGGSFNFQIRGTVSGAEAVVFYVAVFGDGKIKANNGSGWTQVGTATFPINTGTWKRITVAANESANTASVYVDGVLAGTTGMYSNPANTTNLTGFAFCTNGTSTQGEVVYFDDVNFYDPSTGEGPSGVNSVVSENTVTNTLSMENPIGELSVSVAPNPVSGVAKIRIEGAEAGNLQLYVTSINGVQVKKRQVTVCEGSSTIEQPVSDLAHGVYMIMARQGNKTSQCRVMIQ
jgi:hypothetical protein